MPLMLPRSYGGGSVIRIPTVLNTIGDHMRRKRLGLKMLQRDVALKIGVDNSKPDIEFLPAIITFVGYNPMPAAKGWGERLVRQRME